MKYTVEATFVGRETVEVEADNAEQARQIVNEMIADRDLLAEDVRAEGFDHAVYFWDVWASFYDPPMHRYFTDVGMSRIEAVKSELADRPAHLYQAWALTFELVNRTQPPSLRGFVVEQAPAIADLFR